MLSLLLPTFSVTSAPMELSRFEVHSIFAEATKCNMKIVDWLCNFLTHTHRKTLAVLSSQTNVKKIRHQENNYLENKHQPSADRLAIYEVKPRF